MPTAKKTSAHSWKVRVYSHTDEDGKQHYRAFTGSTKQEAEEKAARYTASADRQRRQDVTVGEAIEGYISSREGVLSPSTILGYRKMQNCCFKTIASRRVHRLTSHDVQVFISEHAKTRSPKTVSNIYGLLTSSVALYAPEMHFRVKLPTIKKKRSQSADDAKIMVLFNRADDILKKCIALGAFTSMRRGEISALKYGDIDGQTIHIHADMVKGVSGWVYKDMPKTADSDRIVPVPVAVIELLGTGDPEEYIIPWKPDTITKRFIDLRNECGLNDIRFHDLRHYYASICAYIGIPDIVLARYGGWSKTGSNVMKEVYQNPIESMSEKYASAMTAHFSDMLSKT